MEALGGALWELWPPCFSCTWPPIVIPVSSSQSSSSSWSGSSSSESLSSSESWSSQVNHHNPKNHHRNSDHLVGWRRRNCFVSRLPSVWLLHNNDAHINKDKRNYNKADAIVVIMIMLLPSCEHNWNFLEATEPTNIGNLPSKQSVFVSFHFLNQWTALRTLWNNEQQVSTSLSNAIVLEKLTKS